MLVPQSLAIVTAAFCDEDRGAAIEGLVGTLGALDGDRPVHRGLPGRRLVVAMGVPAERPPGRHDVVARRAVPETSDARADPRLDVPGAITVTLGLAGVVYALIEVRSGFETPAIAFAGVAGAALLVAVEIERRSPAPMVPLGLFRSRRFTGANLTTFTVYAALGVGFFFVSLQLQTLLGYSALEAGPPACRSPCC